MIDADQLAVLDGPSPETGRIHGVVIGVVTEQDRENGRVKVRFSHPSGYEPWARVVSPTAGNDRGLYMLPQLDDEVLVAFELGLVGSSPYVLGALWNGQAKPPRKNGDGEKGDAGNDLMLKSRSGHIIRIDDTEGREKIEIVDAKGKQSLVFDTAAGTLTITAEKDVVIESKSGQLKLVGKKGVEIEAPDGAAKLEARQSLDVKSSGGQVNVKGSTINLN